MRDDFRLVAKIYDSIIKPKEEISWKKYICNSEPQSLLLDVGGGTGRIANAVVDCFEKIIIYDISIPMLLQSKSKNKKISSVCGSVNIIPFNKETFSSIIMVDTLHHIENQRNAVLSICQSLKSGGIFIIEEPNIRKIAVKIIAILEKILFMRSHFLPSEIIRNWIDQEYYEVQIYEEAFNFFFIIRKK